MTYDQVFDVIKSKMSEVIDDLDIKSVDAQKSMMDYGADSLQVVEIMSRVASELKVKIPRVELVTVKNLDDLIKLFEKHLP